MKRMGKTYTALILGVVASVATMPVAAKGHGMEAFKAADANGDGVVTKEEVLAKAKGHFDAFDANKDGFLELGELPKEMPVPEHMQKRLEKMKEHMEKMGKGDDERHGFMQRRGKPSRMNFIAKHDVDGDERVSFEEFSSHALRFLERADKNGDGKVTEDEAKTMHQHHREKMKKRVGDCE